VRGVYSEDMASRPAFIDQLLAKADIRIDGDSPWDLVVHDERTFSRLLRSGSLGLGEAYMDGWLDAPALDQFFARVLSAHLDEEVRANPAMLGMIAKAVIFNMQSGRRAFTVGEVHYDLGNDLYQAMLDKSLTYTCGYWRDATTLDEAQEAKLDLVCRKLDLKRGDRVLDIGCGWGSFARHAATHYGATVVGITISKEQVALAQELCAGLPVEIRLQDYRDVHESFDHIVSLGMFEHVGRKNYRAYFDVARRCLKDGGLFLLHTIGRKDAVPPTDPWLNKYIFPGGVIPSMTQITKAVGKKFVIEDWHNFGADYDKTLMAWFANFDAGWPALEEKYGKRFYRMWKYYLLQCAGAFRARNLQLWQVVLSKEGVEGGYRSIR